MSKVKSTFCVTFCDKDWHLIERCVEFILLQSVKPDKVMFVGSGLLEKTHTAYDLCLKLGKGFKEYGILTSPTRKLPGWARNNGAFFNQGSKEIVSFCDVDDDIHPKKCEFVKKVFVNPDVDALVHNYSRPEVPTFPSWQSVNDSDVINVEQVIDMEPIPDPVPEGWFNIPRTNVITVNKEPVAHGPISIRGSIAQHFRYKENMSLGEDRTFCGEIVNHPDFNLYYTPKKLIIYN